MLGVVRDSRGVAITPAFENFVTVLNAPVAERVAGGVDAGFLGHFTRRRCSKRLVFAIEAAGHRLPEPGRCGALDEQHLQVCGMDHHQYGTRDLILLHVTFLSLKLTGKPYLPRVSQINF